MELKRDRRNRRTPVNQLTQNVSQSESRHGLMRGKDSATMDGLIKLLHLEDDPADAELVKATLEDAGLSCRIHCVQTRETFETALVQGGIDIILADYKLPMFDGISALWLTQELDREIPFIFVSGTMGEEAAIEGLTEGATDYVLKQRLSRLS